MGCADSATLSWLISVDGEPRRVCMGKGVCGRAWKGRPTDVFCRTCDIFGTHEAQGWQGCATLLCKCEIFFRNAHHTPKCDGVNQHKQAQIGRGGTQHGPSKTATHKPPHARRFRHVAEDSEKYIPVLRNRETVGTVAPKNGKLLGKSWARSSVRFRVRGGFWVALLSEFYQNSTTNPPNLLRNGA